MSTCILHTNEYLSINQNKRVAMKTLKHVEMEGIEAIIRKCDICYVGVVDGDLPYVLPMNFGYT